MKDKRTPNLEALLDTVQPPELSMVAQERLMKKIKNVPQHRNGFSAYSLRVAVAASVALVMLWLVVDYRSGSQHIAQNVNEEIDSFVEEMLEEEAFDQALLELLEG